VSTPSDLVREFCDGLYELLSTASWGLIDTDLFFQIAQADDMSEEAVELAAILEKTLPVRPRIVEGNIGPITLDKIKI